MKSQKIPVFNFVQKRAKRGLTEKTVLFSGKVVCIWSFTWKHKSEENLVLNIG